MTGHHTRILLGAAIAAAALVAPRARSRVEACSPGGSSVGSRSSIPADGDVGVPRNVLVRVEYRGSGIPRGTFSLRVAGGAEVALDPVGGGFRPAQPLAPSTTYELVDTLEVPCTPERDDEAWASCTVEPYVFATFTTGAAIDDTPPTFGGLTGLDSEYVEDALESCDQPLSALRVTLRWTPAVDDQLPGGIRYNIYNEDRRIAQVASLDGVSGLAYCGGRPYVNPYSRSFDGSPGRYRVRAVDAAGNTDTNYVTLSTGECGAGCAAGGPSGSPAAALALVLLALVNARPPGRRPR